MNPAPLPAQSPMVDSGDLITVIWQTFFLQKVLAPIAQMGLTVPIAFNAANFTGNGAMTWTPMALTTTLVYALLGTRMILDFYIAGSSVGGVADSILIMTIPDQFEAQRRSENAFFLGDNGVFSMGVVVASGTTLQFFRSDLAHWTLSAGLTSLQGQIIFEVARP